MKNIYSQIIRLVSYGINVGLLEPNEKTEVTKSLMQIMKINEPYEDFDIDLTDDNVENLKDILKNLLEMALNEGLFSEDTTTDKDLLNIKIRLLTELIFR